MVKARVGIIGCGIGNLHAGNLARLDNGELAALCDLDPKRLQEATDKHGCRGFTSVETMLDTAPLDAVLICTPPYVRLPLIEQIAARGLAVFCEKPPASDMATARAVQRVLERAQVVNSVGFMYRWMQAADFAKSLIADRPVLVCQITGIWEVLFWAHDGKISRDYFYRDRAGGPLVEQGVHLIDAARFVLNDEVARIHARGANVVNSLSETFTVEESIQTSMQWRKGTVGSHVHCWAHHGQVFQILFAGVDFALTLDFGTNRVFGRSDGEAIDRKFDDEYYVTELRGFCQAVLNHDQSLIRGSYADACRTLAVATTAMQSIDMGLDLPVPHW